MLLRTRLDTAASQDDFVYFKLKLRQKVVAVSRRTGVSCEPTSVIVNTKTFSVVHRTAFCKFFVENAQYIVSRDLQEELYCFF